MTIMQYQVSTGRFSDNSNIKKMQTYSGRIGCDMGPVSSLN